MHMTWEACACLTVLTGMSWENLRRILGLPRKTSRRTLLWIVLKSRVGRLWEASKWSMGWGCLGCPCFQRMGWEGFRKCQNKSWKGIWVFHGSQEWGGKGLGRLKIKHGRGLDGLGRVKTNHEKGFDVSWFLFPIVGWEGFGGSSMRTSTTTSCCWGAVGRGIYHMKWDFQGGNDR